MKNWQLLFDRLYKDGLFDHDWYAKRYDDVIATGLSPLEHYVKYGLKLGRKIKNINAKSKKEYINSEQNKKNILVSVICITYNHENFIAQTLNSILMQETDFEFEVLVGNDASKDRTGDIIKTFEEKNDNIIFIDRKSNVGANKNFIELAKLVKGKYVAICEGDDYWTDVKKLQSQVDFMENNPEYTICFHPVKIVYEENKEKTSVFPSEIPDFMNFETLSSTNFIQTNSVLYKWRFNSGNYLEFDTRAAPTDWYIHLLHAEVGRIGYLDKIMGVYRKHRGGMWASHVDLISRFKKLSFNEITLFKILDEKYRDTVGKKFLEAQHHIFSTLAKNYLFESDFSSLFDLINDHKDIAEFCMNKMGYNIGSNYNTYKELSVDIKSQAKTSIIVTSYNHEKYIKRCIDSIIMQKTFFDIEIIVGDDCSSDRTSEIILDYSNKYPNLIKKIDRYNNVGMLKNMKDCIEQCTGNYIAFCEADDFWISDRYLYKKIEIMKSDSEIGMCFNWLLLNIEDSSSYIPHAEQGKISEGFVSFSELISSPLTANFSCCFYKKDALAFVPDAFFLRKSAADWLLNLYVAEKYKIYFTKDILSVYTIHSKGQWSGMSHDERSKEISSCKEEFRSIFSKIKPKKFAVTNYVGRNEFEDLYIACWLDQPTENTQVKDVRNVSISGWALAKDFDDLSIFIKYGAIKKVVELDVIRKDVVEAIYGNKAEKNISKCGFKTEINFASCEKAEVFIQSYGKNIHWLDIEIVDSDL